MRTLRFVPMALLLANVWSSTAPAASSRTEVLPFIADDYPRALAEARLKKRPIFLEAWAPW